MKIISLNTGMPKEIPYKSTEFVTGIGKSPIKEVYLTTHNFEGDGVANPEFHGGPDRAVCFYPYEHYEQWENEFSSNLLIPAFGENLTVTGMLEKDICIGDIYQIGGAVIQISQGRIPCSTISKYNDLDPLLKRVVDTCYSGFFARVLKEGTIREDSEIILIDRHPFEINVHFTMHTYFHDFNIEAVQHILQINELAQAMRGKFEKRLKK